MKKQVLYLVITLLATFCLSCNDKSMHNDMAFDRIDYIESFPKTIKLQDKVDPNINVIGIRNFAIVDSLLVFSTINTEGFLSFVNLDDYTLLGEFLPSGQGPSEFLESPSVATKVKFIKQDSLFAYIYDSQRGKLFKMNIDQSLDNNRLSIRSVNDSLPPFLFNTVVIDSSTIFCKEVNPDMTQQVRYLIHQGEKEIPKVFTTLNDAKIKKGEDINILSTITKSSDRSGKIVEMPIGLNHINLYSLDGLYQKSLFIGKEIEDIESIQKKSPGSRLYTFADLRLFDDFFAVLHINEDEATYQTGRKQTPAILIFDWDGKPLMKLEVDHHITSFDIDFEKGSLYTFDVHSDEFYKYKISDVLTEI